MTAIDIEKLDFNDLQELREQVDHRIKKMREESLNQLRLRFADEAAGVGLTIDDVMGVQKKKRGRKPKIPQPETMAET